MDSRLFMARRLASEEFYSFFYQWSKPICSQFGRQSFREICYTKSGLHGQGRGARLRTATRQFSTSTSIPSLSSTNESPLSTKLRSLMRLLPHAVVVLTAAVPTPISEPHSPRSYRGMTLSSFTTLTLTPSPIITFNIRRPSKTLDAVCQSRHFYIHLLSATDSGVLVADIFTRGNSNDIGLNLFDHEGIYRVHADQIIEGDFGKEISEPRLALPRLYSDGILGVLKCEVLIGSQDRRSEGIIAVGDHMLVLAKVHKMIGVDSGSSGMGTEGLGYADGKYRRFGDVIEKFQ